MRLVAAFAIAALLRTQVAGQTLYTVTTFAGGGSPGGSLAGSANGIGTSATFNSPTFVDIDASGTYALVSDSGAHTIRSIVMSSANVTTLAGSPGFIGQSNGLGPAARFNVPWGIEISPQSTFAVVADSSNHLVRSISLPQGAVSTIAGSALIAGGANGQGTAATFNGPCGVALNSAATLAYISDNGGHDIRLITISSGVVTTVAGQAGTLGHDDGIGTSATFYNPAGISLDSSEATLLVAEYNNHDIRRITLASSTVTKLAGSYLTAACTDGIGASSAFNGPVSVAQSSSGFALVGDWLTQTIRLVNISSTSVTAIAGVCGIASRTDGIGTSAYFSAPSGVAIYAEQTSALIVDKNNNVIRLIVLAPASKSPSQTITTTASSTRSSTTSSSVTLTPSSTSSSTQSQTRSGTSSLTQTSSTSQTGSITQTRSTTCTASSSTTETQSPTRSQTATTSQTSSVCNQAFFPFAGIDIFGADVQQSAALSSAECAEQCCTSSCGSANFRPDSSLCYQKTALGWYANMLSTAFSMLPLPVGSNLSVAIGWNLTSTDLTSFSVTSLSACVSACAATGGCVACTLVSSTGRCALKASTVGSTVSLVPAGGMAAGIALPTCGESRIAILPPDSDVAGGDLSNSTASSVAECAARCCATVGCGAYRISVDSGMCFLKNVSGWIAGPATLPVTPGSVGILMPPTCRRIFSLSLGKHALTSDPLSTTNVSSIASCATLCCDAGVVCGGFSYATDALTCTLVGTSGWTVAAQAGSVVALAGYGPSRSSSASKTTTPSPSQPPTPSQTVSVGSSATQTASLTATQSQSPSPSKSATTSQGATPSQMPTLSQPPTPSQPPSLSSTPSASTTSSLSTSVSQSRTSTPSDTSTASLSLTSSPTVTTTMSLSASPSQPATQTQSPMQSASASKSTSASTQFSESDSVTASLSASFSISPASPEESPSSSPAHIASAPPSPLSSESRTSPSRTQEATLSPGASRPATPSPSSPPFALSFGLAGVNSDSSSDVDELELSDSLPPVTLHTILSRCPSATIERSTQLLCTTTPRDGSESAVVQATLPPSVQPTSSAISLSCAADSSAPVLPFVVFLLPTFGSPAAKAALVCDLMSTLHGIGHATINVSLVPTLWPTFDDVIVVASNGFSRSIGSLKVINSTDSLLRASVALSLPQSIAGAFASPSAVLAAMQETWGALPASPSSAADFSLTLSASTPLVLRSRKRSFLHNSTVAVGGVECNLTVSHDGQWVALIAPNPNTICGDSLIADCSYATITITNPPSDGLRGVGLACPPFCSESLAPGSGVVPLVVSSGTSRTAAVTASGVAAAKLLPSGIVQPLTATDYASSSVRTDGSPVYPSGLYYAVACSAAGIYTDPATGACTNMSSPLFPLCAFGGGDACQPCPSGAMCPGGFRCWTLPGFYVTAESSREVLTCGAPAATSKCTGWSAALAQTRCGAGYLQGSYLCGACSSGYFLQDDGSCERCPAVASVWDRFGTLFLLLLSVVGFTLIAFFLMTAVIRASGGNVKGLTASVVRLLVHMLTVLQVFSSVSQVNSARLPLLIQGVYRAVRLLQLQGVAIPASCTGGYYFASDVSVMAVGILTWALAIAFGVARWRCGMRGRAVRLVVHVAISVAVYLHPPVSSIALRLVSCHTVHLTTAALATLEGGEGATLASPGRSSSTVTANLLTSNPYVVCFAGSHVSAGIAAVITLVVYVVGLPALTLYWLWRDPNRRRAAANVSLAANPKLRPRRREPILAPFMQDSGYTPRAWFWRHLDMCVVLGLTVIAALLPLPASMVQLAIKLALTFALLGVLLVCLCTLPNPYEQPWRWYLRVGLVSISASCVIVNGATRSLDLGHGGAALEAFVAPASYINVAVLCITVLVLLVGFGRHLFVTATRRRSLSVSAQESRDDGPAGELTMRQAQELPRARGIAAVSLASDVSPSFADLEVATMVAAPSAESKRGPLNNAGPHHLAGFVSRRLKALGRYKSASESGRDLAVDAKSCRNSDGGLVALASTDGASPTAAARAPSESIQAEPSPPAPPRTSPVTAAMRTVSTAPARRRSSDVGFERLSGGASAAYAAPEAPVIFAGDAGAARSNEVSWVPGPGIGACKQLVSRATGLSVVPGGLVRHERASDLVLAGQAATATGRARGHNERRVSAPLLSVRSAAGASPMYIHDVRAARRSSWAAAAVSAEVLAPSRPPLGQNPPGAADSSARASSLVRLGSAAMGGRWATPAQLPLPGSLLSPKAVASSVDMRQLPGRLLSAAGMNVTASGW